MLVLSTVARFITLDSTVFSDFKKITRKDLLGLLFIVSLFSGLLVLFFSQQYVSADTLGFDITQFSLVISASILLVVVPIFVLFVYVSSYVSSWLYYFVSRLFTKKGSRETLFVGLLLSSPVILVSILPGFIGTIGTVWMIVLTVFLVMHALQLSLMQAIATYIFTFIMMVILLVIPLFLFFVLMSLSGAVWF